MTTSDHQQPQAYESHGRSDQVDEPARRDEPYGMKERFAVAIVGDLAGGGWIVEAHSAADAISIVRDTVPRAGEVWCGELLVWTESYYRERYLLGGDCPAAWTEL